MSPPRVRIFDKTKRLANEMTFKRRAVIDNLYIYSTPYARRGVKKGRGGTFVRPPLAPAMANGAIW
jgi:hypothetical protein